MDLLTAAHNWREAGCAVVPVATDGTKMPAVAWKTYQHTQPNPQQLSTWFANGRYDGLGIICGTVSGHLEMFELEGRAIRDGIKDQLAQALREHGLGAIWDALNNGYMEITPGAGLHWYYRVSGPARRNTKLARRPATEDELADNPDEKIKVLVETRGEGGFTVVAPSGGRSHFTGAAWIAVTGNCGTIPTLSEDQRDALYAIATLFDRIPVQETWPDHGGSSVPGDLQAGQRPGDDYNQRADWADILTPAGWIPVTKMGRGHAWRRPGKDRGISATTGQSGDGADRLYVFSTSTPFDSERPYSKFAATALLEHGGDYRAAAKALRAGGYGARPAAGRPALTVIDGTAVRVIEPAAVELPYEPHTDLGNARRLVAAHGTRLRYVPPWGKWFIWDGKRWAQDQTGQAPRYAKDLARQILDEAKAETDPKLRDKLIAGAKRAESAHGVRAMLELAGTETGIALAPSELDRYSALLNTASGILDLATGELLDHDPALHMTKITGAGYDPDAEAPEFIQFLERIQPDERMRDFLARLFGHALLGKVVEHILAILYGIGANGKTTLVEAITAVLGDYARPIEPGLLIDRGDVHPTGTAALFGLRLAITHETDAGRRLAEATVKRLTGGDMITARRMREDFWDFEPSHSIVMHTNHKPIVRGTDEGIWRRLRFIPFDVVIPENERDGKLPERLRSEADGILAWIVAGYRQWQDRGLAEPSAVTDATSAFRGESDMLALFLAERCMTNQFATVRSSELFAAWMDWCKRENLDAGTQTAFSRELLDRGFDKDHSNRGNIWRGIGLYTDEEDQ